MDLHGSIYTTCTFTFCLSPHPQQHFLSDSVLSVWPECGPQPWNDSDPPGGEAETLYPKASFSGLPRFQGAEAKETVMA